MTVLTLILGVQQRKVVEAALDRHIEWLTKLIAHPPSGEHQRRWMRQLDIAVNLRRDLGGDRA